MNTLITMRDMQNLPEAESHVRDFILKNAEHVTRMTIYDLAQQTYTSTATIIRFSRRIGCKGFGDLKIRIAAELNAFSNINFEFTDLTIISQDDNEKEIVNKITGISLKSIEETRILLDEVTLMTVAKQMMAADILDFYGMGASNTIAFDAAYKFMRIGKNVSCFSVSDRQYVQAVNSGRNHFALLISYSGQTKEMINIANALQKANVSSCAITRNSDNDLIRLTDYHLYVCGKESVFRSGAMVSRTSTLYMIDLLYSLCISLSWGDSLKNIQKSRVVS